MQAILVGDGPAAAPWLAALSAHRKVAKVVQLPQSGAQDPAGNGLDALLAQLPGAVAVLADTRALEPALAALAAGRCVFVADVGAMAGEELARLHATAAGGRGRVLLPRTERYGRCAATLRGFIASGRLGVVGHVACIDYAPAAPLERVTGGRGYLAASGAGLLAEILQVLGANPVGVMAQLPAGGPAALAAQAYVETSAGVDIHYAGHLRAGAAMQELWIEGSGGSLRSDGRFVWWRKRGWRFFVPVRFGLAGAKSGTPELIDRLAALSAAGTARPDDRVALGIAAAAALAGERGEPVAIAALGAPQAAAGVAQH